MTIKSRLTNYISILFTVLISIYVLISIDSLNDMYQKNINRIPKSMLNDYAGFLEKSYSKGELTSRDYEEKKTQYLQIIRRDSRNRVLKDEILLNHILKLILYTVPVFILSILLIFFVVAKVVKPIKKMSKILDDYHLNIDLKTLLEKNSTTEFVILVRSITRLMNKIKKYEIQQEDIERTKGWHEMSRAITHEISNFLLPIDIALAQGVETKDDLDKMKVQFNKIKLLLNELRSFYKGNIKRNIENICVASELKFICEGYGVELGVEESCAKELIVADRLDFDKLMINLIKNAKESSIGHNDSEVKVLFFNEKEFLSISVSDNGDGIKSELLDEIFSPNFSTKEKGMGLGLAMVKNIVSSYGWELEINSKVGYGTVFFIKIPRNENV